VGAKASETAAGPTGIGLIAAGIVAAAAFAVLVSLGIWQMQRLTWKEGLIAQIEARSHAAPVPLPPRSGWASLDPETYEYRRVTATGTFEHDREVQVFRASGPNAGLSQPGYLVITPLRLADGAHVLVTRGFVPESNRDPATRSAGQIGGEVTIVGLMRAPETRNAFTPADDPGRNAWFTRDPALIARHLGLADAAPFSIDADATPVPGGLPRGGATVVSIKNDHLSYALTWFGLAATLVVVFGLVMLKRLRDA
jgi:surfeit locus 1 family protein